MTCYSSKAICAGYTHDYGQDPCLLLILRYPEDVTRHKVRRRNPEIGRCFGDKPGSINLESMGSALVHIVGASFHLHP